MEIRLATLSDVPQACNVLRRSISKLCSADHQNDPEILSGWLANKTPENVTSWIGQSDISLLVAAEGPTILGVGMVTHAGEIQLLYVSPDARLRGVSKSLLKALEHIASEHGKPQCVLTSTESAHSFYKSCGYADNGLPGPDRLNRLGGYPMIKILTRQFPS